MRGGSVLLERSENSTHHTHTRERSGMDISELFAEIDKALGDKGESEVVRVDIGDDIKFKVVKGERNTDDDTREDATDE